MRRVDRRTNALPDQPTNRPTDTASYRGALSHLKKRLEEEKQQYVKSDPAQGMQIMLYIMYKAWCDKIIGESVNNAIRSINTLEK